MLHEIKNVKQHVGEGTRRWFTDNFFDLILWYEGPSLCGFQLCYDKNYQERSLTWRKGDSYAHNKVDSGEVPGQSKSTPLLVADGLFDKQGIAERFKKDRWDLPVAVVATFFFIFLYLMMMDIVLHNWTRVVWLVLFILGLGVFLYFFWWKKLKLE